MLGLVRPALRRTRRGARSSQRRRAPPRRRDAWVLHEDYSRPWVATQALLFVSRALEVPKMLEATKPTCLAGEFGGGDDCAVNFMAPESDCVWNSVHPCARSRPPCEAPRHWTAARRARLSLRALPSK